MTTRIDPLRVTATEHLVREYFGDPAAFGMTKFPLTASYFEETARLVLAIVGADGKVSSTERAMWENSARFWGTPEAEIHKAGSIDVSKVTIESLMSLPIRKAAGVFLYDAVRIASVDGFHEKERQVTIKAARAMGLDPTIVPAIEGLVALSKVVLEARHRLLQVPAEHAGDGPRVPPSIHRAVEYGSAGAAPVSIMQKIPPAIKIICAGDGDVTDAEMACLVGQGRVAGMTDEGVEAIVKFDPVGKRIEDFVDASLRPYARMMLFDAIRAARVDGFSSQERAIADRAATKLGLDPTFVVALENQIRTEDALREARFTLLTSASR